MYIRENESADVTLIGRNSARGAPRRRLSWPLSMLVFLVLRVLCGAKWRKARQAPAAWESLAGRRGFGTWGTSITPE